MGIKEFDHLKKSFSIIKSKLSKLNKSEKHLSDLYEQIKPIEFQKSKIMRDIDNEKIQILALGKNGADKSMTVPQLKMLLHSKKLPISGNKSQLITRLSSLYPRTTYPRTTITPQEETILEDIKKEIKDIRRAINITGEEGANRSFLIVFLTYSVSIIFGLLLIPKSFFGFWSCCGLPIISVIFVFILKGVFPKLFPSTPDAIHLRLDTLEKKKEPLQTKLEKQKPLLQSVKRLQKKKNNLIQARERKIRIYQENLTTAESELARTIAIITLIEQKNNDVRESIEENYQSIKHLIPFSKYLKK